MLPIELVDTDRQIQRLCAATTFQRTDVLIGPDEEDTPCHWLATAIHSYWPGEYRNLYRVRTIGLVVAAEIEHHQTEIRTNMTRCSQLGSFLYLPYSTGRVRSCRPISIEEKHLADVFESCIETCIAILNSSH